MVAVVGFLDDCERAFDAAVVVVAAGCVAYLILAIPTPWWLNLPTLAFALPVGWVLAPPRVRWLRHPEFE